MRRQGRLILVRAAAAPEGVSGEHAPWDAFAALTPRDVTDLEVARRLESGGRAVARESPAASAFRRAESAAGDPPGGGADPAGGADRAGPQPHRRFDFAAAVRGSRRTGRVARDPRQRQADAWLKAQIELAESTQAGSSVRRGGRGNRTRSHPRSRSSVPHSRIAAGAARELTAVRP